MIAGSKRALDPDACSVGEGDREEAVQPVHDLGVPCPLRAHGDQESIEELHPFIVERPQLHQPPIVRPRQRPHAFRGDGAHVQHHKKPSMLDCAPRLAVWRRRWPGSPVGLASVAAGLAPVAAGLAGCGQGGGDESAGYYGLIALIVIGVPLAIAVLFGSAAFHRLRPFVFRCGVCGRTFRGAAERDFPQKCARCGSRDWNRPPPASDRPG